MHNELNNKMIISITLWAVTFWSCFYSPMAISQSLYSAVVVNSLKDSDNDGVINARDLCPDTPKDSDIDNDGCPVTELEYFSFNFDIQFQTASYKLNPEFLPRLKALVLFLQKSPNTLILIEGHTDNIGAESFNLALSKKRAEAIADALTSSFNISPERIKTFGYGQERPIASNDTETGRKKNRRVTGEIVTPFHFQQKQEDAQDKNSINPVSHSNKSELIIPFKRNHVGVKNSYQPSLQGLGEALQNTPDTLAIIEGYTDNSGSKNYNIQLSLKRAKRVAQLLSSEFAIPQDRLKVLGHGPSFPIASNDSAQGRAQNRRVSAQVVQKFKASKEVILPKWTIWSVDQLEQPKEKKN